MKILFRIGLLGNSFFCYFTKSLLRAGYTANEIISSKVQLLVMLVTLLDEFADLYPSEVFLLRLLKIIQIPV